VGATIGTGWSNEGGIAEVQITDVEAEALLPTSSGLIGGGMK
jgi:hypothetical protein